LQNPCIAGFFCFKGFGLLVASWLRGGCWR
jgi:hypothetical protein